MPRRSLRKPNRLLDLMGLPSEFPIFIVQTGLLREKFPVLGTEEPLQLRDLMLWSNEEQGTEWGILVHRRQLGELDAEEREELLGAYLGPVAEGEFARIGELRVLEQESTETCQRLADERRLAMEVLGADWRFDRQKVTLHFVSEQRVDFRSLVRELAAIYRKVRIELHQVGVRDETAVFGGMGTCGKELCCHQHLNSFPTVSVKMARAQNLPVSPAKTSGPCGRLKCCLRYEYDTYEELAAVLPELGSRRTFEGRNAEIVQRLPLTGRVVVRLEDGVLMSCRPEEWIGGRLEK